MFRVNDFAMKTVTLYLPESVQLGAQQLQELLLQKLAEIEAGGSATVQVPAQDAAETRHLIGLYYSEKAANLMGDLWDQNGWDAANMQQWLSEKMRAPYSGEPVA